MRGGGEAGSVIADSPPYPVCYRVNALKHGVAVVAPPMIYNAGTCRLEIPALAATEMLLRVLPLLRFHVRAERFHRRYKARNRHYSIPALI